MSIPVYDSKNMQAWDRFTIENEPIASIDLMERAASLATKVILSSQHFQSVSIFCGPGNNGGDGLVIARLLHQQKKTVQLFLLRFGNDSDDFKTNRDKLPEGIKIIELNEDNHTIETSDELVIDTIFGSGLDRPVKGWIGKVIDQMNQLQGKKVAIDIPSGLFAVDNHKNEDPSHIFKAKQTLTFMAPKMPFFFKAYKKYVGKLRILDIELHPDFSGDAIAKYVTGADIHLQRRNTFDHKNKNGVLSLIAGFEDMNGAAIIASRSAMKSGCGYLLTISSNESKAPLNTVLPEAIWQDSSNKKISKKTDAIAIGPGIGQGDKAKSWLNKSLESNLPLVIDADAINLLAKYHDLRNKLPENTILTPHLGELQRLVGTFDNEEELLQAQVEFSKRHKVFILQKGAYSKITTPEGEILVNSTGNPGMGTAGMGDALTGIIGSLLAQGYNPKNAVIFGTYLHGYSADKLYVNIGELGWVATDVINELPHTINQYSC